MITLIIATRNAHKLDEIRALLSYEFAYLTLRDLPAAPPVLEDAASFAGNASKKAVELSYWLARNPGVVESRGVASGSSQAPPRTGWFCLADDSGLEVDALDGAPGVHSARFAALDSGADGNSSDQANNAKLLRLMAGVPPGKRSARFRCALALTPVGLPGPAAASPVCYADELELQTEIFEGACEGQILTAPRGVQGFGYDPLFVPNGLSESFGELSESRKNEMSHRAHALRKLRARLADRMFSS